MQTNSPRQAPRNIFDDLPRSLFIESLLYQSIGEGLAEPTEEVQQRWNLQVQRYHYHTKPLLPERSEEPTPPSSAPTAAERIELYLQQTSVEEEAIDEEWNTLYPTRTLYTKEYPDEQWNTSYPLTGPPQYQFEIPPAWNGRRD